MWKYYFPIGTDLGMGNPCTHNSLFVQGQLKLALLHSQLVIRAGIPHAHVISYTEIPHFHIGLFQNCAGISV